MSNLKVVFLAAMLLGPFASGPVFERKPLDAALFAPPADYQKMAMPAGMPTAPRGPQ
jgi:hypothetical protein